MTEWWRINTTSRIALQNGDWLVVETGGWFDIYCGRFHMYGTINLFEALTIAR